MRRTPLGHGVHVSVILKLLNVMICFNVVGSYNAGAGAAAIDVQFLGVQRKVHRNKTLAALGYIIDPKPMMQDVSTTGMEESRLENGQTIYTFPLSQDWVVSASLKNSGSWEGANVKSICSEFEKTGGQADFLDVGANVGAYSIPMGQCLKDRGHGGKVIAVEGLPNTARYLKASVTANHLQDTVDIYNYAVSDGQMGADSVRMDISRTNKGGSSIDGNKPPDNGDVQDATVVEAKVTTLDSILHRNGQKPKIFAVKMDIEGSEGHALLGAQEFLSKASPCLLQVELNKEWLSRAGTQEEMVLQLLRKAGFDTPTSMNDEMVTTTFRQKDYDNCVSRFAK